jgi:CHAD domain-containing protein
MSATHLEVETTFDIDPNAELPDLTAAPGVAAVARVPTQRLVATYHDTPDLRLLRSRITLRRRTGGDDPGWHLKLPTDRGRLEVHAAPERPVTRVPAELRSLTRSVVRREQLGVIARLTTWRRVERLLTEDGGVLAEIARDDVVAEVMDGVPGTRDASTADKVEWHEVEVELVDGGDDVLEALTALLREAGARPAPIQSKIARALGGLPAEPRARRRPRDRATSPGRGSAGAAAMAYCRTQVEEILRLDPYVRLDAEDAVHQMRVAARRLRSALATFRPVLDRRGTDPLRDELRWLGQALGDARDLEVLRDRFLTRLEGVAARDADLVRGPVAEQLASIMDRRRSAALDEARRAMDSDRYLDLLEALESLVAVPPFTAKAARPAARVLRSRLAHDSARVLERAAAADEASGSVRDAALHDVRKAAKRARYAGEAVGPVLGGDADRVTKRMRQLQQILGVRQDGAVGREVLADVAREIHEAGGDTFTYGLLVGLESRAGSAGVTADPYAETVAKARKASGRL